MSKKHDKIRDDSSSAFGKAVGVAAITVGVAAVTAATVAVGTASYYARKIITPAKKPYEDVRILGADLGGKVETVTLSKTENTVLTGKPGEYSLLFNEGNGHVVLGDILAEDDLTVTRKIVRYGFGDLEGAKAGLISGVLWLSPRDAGLTAKSVVVPGPLGPNPAWLILGENEKTWAIHIHGLGGQRSETLRSAVSLNKYGLTSLLVSYRNDPESPKSSDGKYFLGDTEWLDVEAAIEYAISNGAEKIILVGWSMGGAIALQTTVRSHLADKVVGLILDSPVVDWLETIRYQAESAGLPNWMHLLAVGVLNDERAGMLRGTSTPIGLDRLNWLERYEDLNKPVLLMHSDDDGVIPPSACREFAASRPELVTYVPFHTATHVKLWNYDRALWESSVREWLKKQDLI